MHCSWFHNLAPSGAQPCCPAAWLLTPADLSNCACYLAGTAGGAGHGQGRVHAMTRAAHAVGLEEGGEGQGGQDEPLVQRVAQARLPMKEGDDGVPHFASTAPFNHLG